MSRTRQQRILLGLVVLALVAAGTWTGAQLLGGWKRTKNAEKYLPLLHAAETRYGIPRDLLARLAYQESHFRDDIVSGSYVSSAGALGLMQIVPASHPTAQPLNVPAAIDYAAQFLVSLRSQFGSWKLALAGYNAGAGNVKKYGGVPPFAQTQTYVAQILNDVPGVV